MQNVIKNKKTLTYFNLDIIKKLKKLARNSKNLRSRICIHKNNHSKINEMIIALKKGSYIRPHIHPNSKSESYHVIEGNMIVNVFNKKGKIIKRIKMGPVKSKENFYYRMSKGYYHMPVATSNWCIYHEIYSGPFIKEKDVIFPTWSPKDKHKDGYKHFLKKNKLIRYF